MAASRLCLPVSHSRARSRNENLQNTAATPPTCVVTTQEVHAMKISLNSHCSGPTPFTALAFTALIGLSSQALAISDTKGISGASCHPAMPADATALAYSSAGVTNIGTTSRRVVCPLLTDAETWSTQGVDIYVDRGTVQCVLSIVQVDIDTTLTTRIVNVTNPFVSGHSPGSPFHIWFAPNANRSSAEWAPMTVTCLLGPGARLTEMRYLEIGADTDDPAK
jgi:hypothetical protein